MAQWIERIDSNTDRAYYINKDTRQTQWELPANFKPKPPEETPWKLVLDKSSGKHYYANVETRETRWEPLPEWGSDQYRQLKVQFDKKMKVIRGEEREERARQREEEHDYRQKVKSDRENKQADAQRKKREEIERKKVLHKEKIAEAERKRLEAEEVLRQQEYDRERMKKDAEDEARRQEELKRIRNEEEMKKEEERKALEAKRAETFYQSMAAVEGYKYKMSEFAILHLATPKKSLLGKVVTKHQMLNHQTALIKHALTSDVHSSLQQKAVQAFKNITGFMRDRKSSKEPDGHAEKLLTMAITSEEAIRDEIYVQLVKQTTLNNSHESCLQGWRLFCLSTMTFTPSKNFAPFLATYFYQSMRNSEEIGEMSEFCLYQLDQRMMKGTEFTIPSTKEISHVESSVKPVVARLRAEKDAQKRTQNQPASSPGAHQESPSSALNEPPHHVGGPPPMNPVHPPGMGGAPPKPPSMGPSSNPPRMGPPVNPPRMGGPPVNPPRMGPPVNPPRMGGPPVNPPRMGGPPVNPPRMGGPPVNPPRMGGQPPNPPRMGPPPNPPPNSASGGPPPNPVARGGPPPNPMQQYGGAPYDQSRRWS